jgi:hypothetical protein
MNKFLFAALLIVSVAAGGFAQKPGDYKIGKISPAAVRTPQIQFDGDQKRTGRSEQWLEVEVEFSAKPEFTEELTFKYYILFNGKLLTGEVTHVSIPEGRDLRSVMYISPRTIARLTGGKGMSASSIENVAVQILNKGALVAEESFKDAQPQWYMRMQQITGFVLNKNQTPFAPLYWDRYEAIKSTP